MGISAAQHVVGYVKLICFTALQLKGRDGLTRLLTGPVPNPHEPGSQSPAMAQAHWDFVDSLLEECKHRVSLTVRT